MSRRVGRVRTWIGAVRRAGARRQGVEPRWGGAGGGAARNRVAQVADGRSIDENRVSARVEGSGGVGSASGIGAGETRSASNAGRRRRGRSRGQRFDCVGYLWPVREQIGIVHLTRRYRNVTSVDPTPSVALSRVGAALEERLCVDGNGLELVGDKAVLGESRDLTADRVCCVDAIGP